MAGSISSDSSKTISAVSVSPESSLVSILTTAPHEFLQPAADRGFNDAARRLVKQYVDPLAKTAGTGLLDAIYLEGFDDNQVWEQVRAVVDALKTKTAMYIGSQEKQLVGGRENLKGRAADSASETGSERTTDDEETDGSEQYDEVEGLEEEKAGDALEDSDLPEDMEIEGEGEEEEKEEEEKEEEEKEEEEKEEEKEEDRYGTDTEEEAPGFVEDVHGLNDGFFSIDDFNRQTELMELTDIQAPIGSDAEDDIDLEVDPATLKDSDDESYDEDEKRASKKTVADFEDDSDADFDMEGGLDNTNEIRYEDFFVPPAKKGKKSSQKPKTPWKSRNKALAEDLENEFEKTMSNIEHAHRDLFEDVDESEEEEGEGSAINTADPLSRRSAHQKRQAELTEQIRALEAENVAKKKWTMSGEARAQNRPLDSALLEELDFERTGQPVPVITQEVVESLEDMIRRRIIAAEFDEVIRRRPDDVKTTFRRGRVELDDSKPQQSLAEAYEKSHLQKIDPTNNPDAKDEKLEKEHAEIAALFADVSRKLDALTSWHYTPKPPKPEIKVVTNAPAISIEEAQPSAAAGGELAANVSMLAPQEVYNPRKNKAVMGVGENAGWEITGKSGAPVATREMTSDERKRRRRREKAKIRKRNAAKGSYGVDAKEGSREKVVRDLKKHGAKVIGKGGETRDLEGNLVKEKRSGRSVGAYKL